MSNHREDASGEVMRRVLATESAARRAEKKAQAEAEGRLEKARSDAREIEARAIARIQRIHQQAGETDARQRAALRKETRARLARLASETADPTELDKAVDRVAAWLTGSEDDGFGHGGVE